MNAFNQDGSLNENLLRLTSYEAYGLRFDNKIGLGSVPDVANIGYKGLIAAIRPSVFLELAPPLGYWNKTIKHLQANEVQIGTPFLEVEISEDSVPSRVRGHEGRSRMTFLKDAVDDRPVPVAIFLQDDGPIRHHGIENWMIEELHAGLMSERCKERPSTFMEGPLFEEIIYLDITQSLVRSRADRSWDHKL